MSDVSSCPPESLFPPLSLNDGTGQVCVGSTAGLDDLRQYSPRSHKKIDITPLLEGETTKIDSTREMNLRHIHSAMVTFCFPSESTTSLPHLFDNVQGQVFVTSRRLFFVTMGNANKDFDLAIDSARISLHAMTSDPKYSVYCQLACTTYPENTGSFVSEQSERGGNQVGERVPGEIHISPPNNMTDEKKQEFCQGLFNSLSRLASLNPVSDEDDSGNGIQAMMNMMAATYGGDMEGIVDNEDDMMFRTEPSRMNNIWGDNAEQKTQENISGGATEEERSSMLERLDNVLTVPPEYRSASNYDDNRGAFGQFDDADETGDDLL